MSTDEIRLEQGEFVLVRNGIVEPLICQELQALLLANMESLILGEVTAVAYEECYLKCLAIEQRSRDAKGTENTSGDFSRSDRAGSGSPKAEAYQAV